jgi:5-methyltetrahydrofolate--homocysteine methyltransferase
MTKIYQAVLQGDRDGALAEVQAMVAAGVDPGVVLHDGLIPAMDEVGRLFEIGEYYVPEMMVAARAMQAALGVLKPLLIEADIRPAGKVIIGTVEGDLHDIGKNLVSTMLGGAGFAIIDLGTDVPAKTFLAAIQEGQADILAMSALLTTSMPMMEATIEAIEAGGLRERVKIMVGGAPVTEAYAQQIGADGFAPDASQVVSLAKTLMG